MERMEKTIVRELQIGARFTSIIASGALEPAKVVLKKKAMQKLNDLLYRRGGL